MTVSRPLVLDANILIRYVLGQRVPALLTAYTGVIDFLAPETAFIEARRHLPAILRARRASATAERAATLALDALGRFVSSVPLTSYAPIRAAALARIGSRDPDDWPVLACALLLNCPIWTEDRDFFGTGVATWTTARVELYFKEAASPEAGH
ncbi:PIN domain-containing protein [Roseateles sp.]|uniref:PIN domain-containing protein n=1 Tax=Roseateles sp. TaxID=1971397 RepID=UPI003264B8D8